MNLLGCKNDGTVVDGETVGDDDPSLNMGELIIISGLFVSCVLSIDVVAFCL
jgi:hypothetical protein